jgi:hypothetical protein
MNETIPNLGWREWVSLPDLGVEWTKAKVDTGARSSSLHASDLETFDRDGESWVRFVVSPWQRSDRDPVTVEAPLHETREVRSSTGQTQTRPVIRTTVRIGGREELIDVTLTDRTDMRFRMLLGRESIKRRFIIDPGRSYRSGKPSKSVRSRNRERSP